MISHDDKQVAFLSNNPNHCNCFCVVEKVAHNDENEKNCQEQIAERVSYQIRNPWTKLLCEAYWRYTCWWIASVIFAVEKVFDAKKQFHKTDLSPENTDEGWEEA